jgi:Calcineurin-like phosphoesterase
MLTRGLCRGRVSRAFSVLGVCIAALASVGVSRPAQAADPVVFSFATLGDSRQDPASPDPTTLLAVNPATGQGGPSLTGTLLPQDAIWLQNTKAFSRIIRTIQTEKPNLLFFNGDMIYGYGRPTVPSAWATTPPSTVAAVIGSDLVFEYTQYAFWRGIVAPLFETGTYVIPVPGNHESQCNSKDTTNTGASGCASGKHAYVENENAFRANMGDLVSDLVTNVRFQTVTGVAASAVNGLTAASAPTATANNGPITGAQQELSYSFDIQTGAGLLHFVVINTDPSGADATAPTDWLSADLGAAKARGATKYFVFGHKPAFTYNYNLASGTGGGAVAAGGLDANASIAFRNAFWSVITQYGATYFSGHEHIVNISQNADPTGTYAGTPYQVIVGSGGSPFDETLVGTCPTCSEPVFTNPWDRYYAWALVQIHQSGAVTLTANGFNDAFGPTQLLYSIPNLQ